MTPLNGSTRATALLFGVVSFTFGQGLSPTTPSKEYIRLGGQVIAIENAQPAAAPAVTLSAASLSFSSQTVGTTSVAQAITVTNSGSAVLNITGISLAGRMPATFRKLLHVERALPQGSVSDFGGLHPECGWDSQRHAFDDR